MNNTSIVLILVLIVTVVAVILIALFLTNKEETTAKDCFTMVSDNQSIISMEQLNEIDRQKIYEKFKGNIHTIRMFNLSVIKFGKKYIGTVRINNTERKESFPYYITIDEHKKIRITDFGFDFRNYNGSLENGMEDSRSFWYQNEHWCIVSSIGYKQQKDMNKTVISIFSTKNPTDSFRLLEDPKNTGMCQKNWSPFVYKKKLYCEYSLDPHIIYKIDTENGFVKHSIESTNTYKFPFDTSLLKSGGPPSILVTHFSENFYLGIGHVKTKTVEYYQFFYMFQSYPPFHIVGSSNLFKLDNKEKIQFVTGLSIEEDNVFVSYGIDDCTSKISRFSIYEINEKIIYDNTYIQSTLIPYLAPIDKLSVVTVDFEAPDALKQYCNKHGYHLKTMETYTKNPKTNKNFFLHKTKNGWNINNAKNFDTVLQIAGDSNEVYFEGSKDKIANEYVTERPTKWNLNEYSITKILSVGYPYKEKQKTLLHYNYVQEIFYNKPSIVYYPFFVMPNIIRPRKPTFGGRSKIPKIIHQSFESKAMPVDFVRAAHTWIHVNPEYEYRFYDNSDRRRVIADHFEPNVLKAYDMLIPGSYQCDLWRFCIIYLYGGVYADIKNGAIYPLKDIVQENTDYFLINDVPAWCTYTAIFAAKPNDPILYKIIVEVVKRVLEKDYGDNGLYPTGPVPMGAVVLKEFDAEEKLPSGTYAKNGSLLTVYNHYKEGKTGTISLEKGSKAIISTRHNKNLLNTTLIENITGLEHYNILWGKRKIYRNI
jgi:hypothetical protein